mgnify:CR=1 FL=1
MFRLPKAEEAPNNALQPTRGERVSSTAKSALAETRSPLAAECDVMRCKISIINKMVLDKMKWTIIDIRVIEIYFFNQICLKIAIILNVMF